VSEQHHLRRRSLVALLVVTALGLGYLALAAEPGATGDTAAAAATPAWSVRRVPQPVVHAVGAQRLQAAVDAELGALDACVVATEVGDPVAIVSRSAEGAYIPASTQKVLTGIAALELLGPDFRFETPVVASGPPADGSVDQLWLVGSGDPLLATADYATFLAGEVFTALDPTTPLAELADAIAAAGITSIPGGVHGDDSRYDTERFLPTWSDSYREGGDIGPMGALTVNDGFADYEAETFVDDPALAAAQRLTELLEERGVAVGEPGRSSAPADATPVAGVSSPPLADIVSALIRSSDNLTAELLMKEIGIAVSGEGTTAAGTAAAVAALSELGLPTDGLVMVDGSGLDRGNQVTCPLLIAALDALDRPELAGARDGLAVAAETGTLRPRFVGTELAGRLRGKTGSLSGVSALTGLIELGYPVEFAFLAAGGFSEAEGHDLADQMATILSGYPDSPSADELVPMP
jgi:serine-type D-Ala-D-Ala carboxypeptidase/endopeptidase (penicillin-binding protein 4)